MKDARKNVERDVIQMMLNIPGEQDPNNFYVVKTVVIFVLTDVPDDGTTAVEEHSTKKRRPKKYFYRARPK